MYGAFIFLTMLLWELGGQIDKGFRRIGIPSLLLILVIWRCLNGGIWWQYLPLILIAPEFALGYGPGSWAGKLFKNEIFIRLAYATFMSIPITITAILTGNPGTIFWGVVCIIIAFQVHAGALFEYKKKSFLIEDALRAIAVAVYISNVIS